LFHHFGAKRLVKKGITDAKISGMPLPSCLIADLLLDTELFLFPINLMRFTLHFVLI
jgi:hypothetical protein